MRAPSQAAVEARHRRLRARSVPGLHSCSESGSDGDAPPLPAASLAAEDDGEDDDTATPSLPRAALVARRLARTRAALSLYTRLHWRLIERLRERHRRYVIRHGHIGSKEGAHAAAQRREAMRQAPAAACAVAGCGAPAIALCRHCFSHVCFEEGQQLYRPGRAGAPPRLWAAGDADDALMQEHEEQDGSHADAAAARSPPAAPLSPQEA